MAREFSEEETIKNERELSKNRRVVPKGADVLHSVPNGANDGDTFTKRGKKYMVSYLSGFGTLIMTSIEIKKRTKKEKEELVKKLINHLFLVRVPFLSDNSIDISILKSQVDRASLK